ncbi:unnamed protein product [Xylocopa violacea]|uniref:Uncharacterized protein n=1 Tax=Xylocopa violacea TaxID=135666 RepID=A0ABP1NF57_XYLVO
MTTSKDLLFILYIYGGDWNSRVDLVGQIAEGKRLLDSPLFPLFFAATLSSIEDARTSLGASLASLARDMGLRVLFMVSNILINFTTQQIAGLIGKI